MGGIEPILLIGSSKARAIIIFGQKPNPTQPNPAVELIIAQPLLNGIQPNLKLKLPEANA